VYFGASEELHYWSAVATSTTEMSDELPDVNGAGIRVSYEVVLAVTWKKLASFTPYMPRNVHIGRIMHIEYLISPVHNTLYLQCTLHSSNELSFSHAAVRSNSFLSKIDYEYRKVKVKLSCYTPWRHMGGEEV
jgi:hypothetical protein